MLDNQAYNAAHLLLGSTFWLPGNNGESRWSMNLHQSRTGTILSFCGGALANVRGWTGRLASSVFSVFRRASGSKLFWLALAAVAVVIVVATLKFSTILHGLLRLAYVPKNVPLGPGIVGAGGSGAAGGASGKPPGPKPVPLPAPPTATPTPPPPPYNYPRFPGYPPNPPPANYPNPWVPGNRTQ